MVNSNRKGKGGELELDYVSIGADSQGHHLPEPTPEKIGRLISLLAALEIEVRLKPNLRRIYKGYEPGSPACKGREASSDQITYEGGGLVI